MDRLERSKRVYFQEIVESTTKNNKANGKQESENRGNKNVKKDKYIDVL